MNARPVQLIAALLALSLTTACSEGFLGSSAQPDDATHAGEASEEEEAAQEQGSEGQGSEEGEATTPDEGRPEGDLAQDPEQAHPDDIGAVQEVYFAGRQITVEEIDGEFVYEGDILLPPNMVRFEPVELVMEPGEVPASLEEYNKLTARTKAHWPDGIVYYAIDPALPSQQRVTDAVAHWEQNTNLSFVPRTTQADYVYFTPGSGCSSYIGKIGGRQPVTLASGCSTGSTIHEIGHAIGLWHEHSRADRDNWVTVRWNNIQSGREHNFKTYAQMGYDGAEYTDTLDFGSIMMYGPYSFSSNGQPTITKTDGSTYSIQRSALSTDDIEGLALLYPEGGGEPEYVNGQYYTIAGLTVLRFYDAWYYNGPYGMRAVVLRDGVWYYR